MAKFKKKVRQFVVHFRPVEQTSVLLFQKKLLLFSKIGLQFFVVWKWFLLKIQSFFFFVGESKSERVCQKLSLKIRLPFLLTSISFLIEYV